MLLHCSSLICLIIKLLSTLHWGAWLYGYLKLLKFAQWGWRWQKNCLWWIWPVYRVLHMWISTASLVTALMHLSPGKGRGERGQADSHSAISLLLFSQRVSLLSLLTGWLEEKEGLLFRLTRYSDVSRNTTAPPSQEKEHRLVSPSSTVVFLSLLLLKLFCLAMSFRSFFLPDCCFLKWSACLHPAQLSLNIFSSMEEITAASFFGLCSLFLSCWCPDPHTPSPPCNLRV